MLAVLVAVGVALRPNLGVKIYYNFL